MTGLQVPTELDLIGTDHRQLADNNKTVNNIDKADIFSHLK